MEVRGKRLNPEHVKKTLGEEIQTNGRQSSLNTVRKGDKQKKKTPKRDGGRVHVG